MAMVYLDPQAAARLAERMFVFRGMTSDEARTVAEHLVGANLAGHDSHRVFATLGDLLTTGPTLTNVNDFRAILVE
jgi:glycerate-2-kinase